MLLLTKLLTRTLTVAGQPPLLPLSRHLEVVQALVAADTHNPALAMVAADVRTVQDWRLHRDAEAHPEKQAAGWSPVSRAGCLRLAAAIADDVEAADTLWVEAEECSGGVVAGCMRPDVVDIAVAVAVAVGVSADGPSSSSLLPSQHHTLRWTSGSAGSGRRGRERAGNQRGGTVT